MEEPEITNLPLTYFDDRDSPDMPLCWKCRIPLVLYRGPIKTLRRVLPVNCIQCKQLYGVVGYGPATAVLDKLLAPALEPVKVTFDADREEYVARCTFDGAAFVHTHWDRGKALLPAILFRDAFRLGYAEDPMDCRQIHMGAVDNEDGTFVVHNTDKSEFERDMLKLCSERPTLDTHDYFNIPANERNITAFLLDEDSGGSQKVRPLCTFQVTTVAIMTHNILGPLMFNNDGSSCMDVDSLFHVLRLQPYF